MKNKNIYNNANTNAQERNNVYAKEGFIKGGAGSHKNEHESKRERGASATSGSQKEQYGSKGSMGASSNAKRGSTSESNKEWNKKQ